MRNVMCNTYKKHFQKKKWIRSTADHALRSSTVLLFRFLDHCTRAGPALDLDPPVNPSAWAMSNIGAADSVLFPCSTLRTSEPVNIQNITRSKIGWRAGVMGESHGKRNPRERPATRFGHLQGPRTTHVTTTKSSSCKHPHVKVRL